MNSGHIWIVDYGLGNLCSVGKAVEQAGGRPRLGADPALLQGCRAVILPGVGAFDAAVDNLAAAGLFAPLRDYLAADRPFLGICLGFQLLYAGSEEGRRAGFGVIPGRVVRFPDTVKVPHIGWNSVTWNGPAPPPLFEGTAPGEHFYFVHSYCARGEYETAGAVYGCPFTAALCRGNILGTQFHPEKSGPAGLRLLKNFISRHAGPAAARR